MGSGISGMEQDPYFDITFLLKGLFVKSEEIKTKINKTFSLSKELWNSAAVLVTVVLNWGNLLTACPLLLPLYRAVAGGSLYTEHLRESLFFFKTDFINALHHYRSSVCQIHGESPCAVLSTATLGLGSAQPVRW